jgi:hypothetical protein
MVYVASRTGRNVTIDKFSSCDSGFRQQTGFPWSMSINNVPCPVAGLDRCNDGNILSSPTIAVDDTNPSNVFLGWADSNGSGEDILVALSTDGGKTFPTTVALSSSTTARRYLPWLTVWNGRVHAGWYDKRDATAAMPDLTRYFAGSARIVSGMLRPGRERDLSGGVEDAECAGGFSSVRDPRDCTACNIPASACTVNRSSGGGPKYGDYNGIAAGNGRVLHVWASQTTPGGATAPMGSSGVRAWANVTQFCGGYNQPCCPASPACDPPALVCGADNRCTCGHLGQPCCQPGDDCNPNLVCSAGKVCSCGFGGQPCCGGTDCSSGFICDTLRTTG